MILIELQPLLENIHSFSDKLSIFQIKKIFFYNKEMKNSFLENKSIKSFLDFFSRVLITAIFISAIPGKINSFERTVEYISSKGHS